MACQTVYTINALTLLAAEKDRHYAQVLYRGNLLLADGVGAVWAIHRLTGKKAERVPGVDLILDLSRICAKEKQSVILLGSGHGVAEKAAQKLRQVIPGISIAGSCAGFWEPDQDAEIVNRINHSGAGLLLVGLGQPRQEFFLDTYRNDLQVGVAMGVGGSFDVLSGALKRAPRWMQRVGMEWVFRVIQEPSRIPRMIRLVEFVWRIFFTSKKPKQEKA